MKAATITPEGAGDVGSPNRILREAIDGKVILRTGRRIPGVTPIGGVHHPISVCRMAVGDAYGADQSREGADGDELAHRTETIRRSDCRAVAEYAFRTANRIGGRVYGGPKWTVSPIYEGMLKEEMDAAAERHPEVAYEPVLIDATLAGLVGGAATGAARDPVPEPRRRPALRPGPAAVRLDRRRRVDPPRARRTSCAPPSRWPRRRMARRPRSQGKDIANPMGMILAVAALLHHAAEPGAEGAEPALPGGLRGGPGGHRGRGPDPGPGRPRRDHRVHRRGDLPGAREARLDTGSAYADWLGAGWPPAPAPTRRHWTILPSRITNEVFAVSPVPGPQSPGPGRSVRRKVAVVNSPAVSARTRRAPQGATR